MTGGEGGPERLDLAPGEQALLLATSVGEPLRALPDSAFENLLVVSTGEHPGRVQARVEERGLDPRRVGVVPITGSSAGYDGPLWTGRRVNPSDLTGVSIEFSRAFEYLRPGRGWLCLDNLTTLLMYADEDWVYRLVESIADALRDADVRGVFAVVPETMNEDTRERFGSLTDVEVDLRRAW